jgi:hypothetical protein
MGKTVTIQKGGKRKKFDTLMGKTVTIQKGGKRKKLKNQWVYLTIQTILVV